MSSKHTLFRLFYRLGFTPWDGHPIAQNLQDLVENCRAGKALDLGCGTGDSSIYLAQHGWQVTGVDYVPTALEKARVKAAATKASVDFVRADVTQLSHDGLGDGFPADRRQRLPAQHERRRPRRVRPRSQRRGRAGRTAVDRRVPARRTVRCARRPARRNGTTIRLWMDAAVRPAPSGNSTKRRRRRGTTSTNAKAPETVEFQGLSC